SVPRAAVPGCGRVAAEPGDPRPDPADRRDAGAAWARGVDGAGRRRGAARRAGGSMDRAPDGKRWIIGVDLGGTNIVVGVLPFSGGEVLALRTAPTEAARGAKFVVDRITSMIEEAIAEVIAQYGGSREDFCGVGIGSPGPLDRKSGVVINTPNLGWRNFPLRDLISNAVGLPATLDNDA